MNRERVAALLRELADEVEAGGPVLERRPTKPPPPTEQSQHAARILAQHADALAFSSSELRGAMVPPLDVLAEHQRRIPSVVYFVQGESGGPVKIGTTTSILMRFRTLEASSPARLVLRAMVPGGPAEESAEHLAFAELRMHGEWFSPAPRLLARMRQIRGFSDGAAS